MSLPKFLKTALSALTGRSKRFRDQQGFDYTVSIANGFCDMAEKYSQWHGAIFSQSFLRHKRSDTLFILGSGPGIREISPAQWQHIQAHDSIGFNWWMIHPFVPSFYLLQFAKAPDMINMIRSHSEAYKDVPLILRGDYFATGQADLANDPAYGFLKNHQLHYLREYPIASRCAIDIQKLFRHVETLGMLSHGQVGSFVPKWRSTLGLLMSLAYQMGYQRIVLCGMDMHSNDHFWHHPSYDEIRRRHNLADVIPAKKKSQGYGVMAFTDDGISPNTVPKYVTSLADWMKARAGVQTFVISPQTVLYPALPVYESSGQ